MKKLLLLPLVLGFAFCTSQKSIVAKEPIVSITSCPDDGKCSVEIVRNKRMEIKTDDLGSLYYQLIDSPETSVIVYQYNLNVAKDLQDGNYREEIVFEIKNSDKKINLSGKALQQNKMLFGRFCFCRGQTGYYKVEEGTLSLTEKDNIIDFNLDFTITKVPQIIKSIQTTVK
jgi:hypothetical protein